MTEASWTAYRAILSAESPIHVGWHGLGSISRTRYYLPARAVWGIFVSGLAQRLPANGSGSELYRAAEKNARDGLRFTPFFAIPDSLRDEDAFRPRYELGVGLRYGQWSPAEFEHCFVSSFSSTALNVETLGHEQGALHESEFLTPKGQDDNETPLCFVGYLLIEKSLDANVVFDILRNCWVGADRRYGWGNLKMRGDAQRWTGRLFGEYELEQLDASAGPSIRPTRPGCILPAHTVCDPILDNYLEGELEVVVGRDWSEKGSGQQISSAEVCWVPGSRFRPFPEDDLRFQIDSKGFWKAKYPNQSS